MSKVLVTGSAGFIGGYVVKELLDRGHTVVGIDNYSKYGPVRRSYDDHPRYRFIEADARDVDLMTAELSECDHFIAGAALIGGISYFHTYAYDLLATNERITASSCDAAITAPAYRMAIDAFGLRREKILFVAFAGWDAAGAKWFGYTTFWVNRLNLPAERLGVSPDGVGNNLNDLVSFVKALQ